MTRDPRKPYTLEEIEATLSPAQRARIRARAAVMAAEEMSLAQLRKARAMTQAALARKLGKTQALVSRIESAGDLYLSTMRKQIEALGGDLDIRAVFPDMAPVSIGGFRELATGAVKKARNSRTGLFVKPARKRRALRQATKR